MQEKKKEVEEGIT